MIKPKYIIIGLWVIFIITLIIVGIDELLNEMVEVYNGRNELGRE